jgi:hypothetical protein
MQGLKIIARYRDGRMVKGQTLNFSPDHPSFILQPADGGKSYDVELCHLKAIFFVRSFQGNPQYKGIEGFPAHHTYQGSEVEVRFADGEVMVGSTPAYSASLPGFFIFPADPNDNTVKVFAVASAVQNVRLLGMAHRKPAHRPAGKAAPQPQHPPMRGGGLMGWFRRRLR